MAVKGAWILLIPDSDPRVHRTSMKTAKYEGTIVFAPDCDQAIEVCRELVGKGGVQVITLCPAFTNEDVGRIAEAVGKGFPLNVCRSDAPSVMRQYQITRADGWFG
jgi:hypothetical protein